MEDDLVTENVLVLWFCMFSVENVDCVEVGHDIIFFLNLVFVLIVRLCVVWSLQHKFHYCFFFPEKTQQTWRNVLKQKFS